MNKTEYTPIEQMTLAQIGGSGALLAAAIEYAQAKRAWWLAERLLKITA